ncbi:putative Zinc finger CCHC domain-containing protein [Septoria linicola]|nr:putative Zinc finger CCHC domain-containing protein [Septoria linicola]
MRLRLQIERNELPPTKVVHTIPSTQLEQTVSQFLQTINSLFPLESTNWDISDYTVLIDGYEATHYTQVGQAFKDEDEVVIKPLGFAELRARTLTGRDQISEDGRHLLDGVPFGRPMLKRPRRPEVRIPARKRQRVEGAEEQRAVVRFEGVDIDEDDEDDEDDADFEDAEMEEVSEKEAAEGSSDSDSSEDDSDSSDSNDSGDSSNDSSDSSDSSDSESESESEASWDGIGEQTKAVGNATSKKAPAKPTASNTAPQQQSLPRQGDVRTKQRNDRRRDSKKLKHLKDAGLLPQTATLHDMYTWQQAQGQDNDGMLVAAQRAKMERERKRLLDQISSGGIEIEKSKPVTESEDDGPPDELSSRLNGTSAEASTEDISDAASTQIMAEVQQAATAVTNGSQATPGSEVEADQAPASKRAKLDTKSMNRLVFGSLGLRTPKTQDERDALQKKLAARPKRAGPVVAPAAPTEESVVEEDEDPDSWRDKIVLIAVECVDEDVILSTPPYPFHQRWDPQYQVSRKRKRARGRQSAAQSNGDFVETYDKYNKDGGGDALNYDDPEEDEELDDSYWEEGALLDDGDEAEEIDLFPKLPDDISSLATLAVEDAKVGDFITYQELSVSAATGWEPKIVTQVAHIESTNEDGSWTILLKQDRPKQYDEDGNRVYRKFEMENFSDDGSDEESKTITYGELQDPRLLLRPVFDKAAS